ncbi:MAG TPA: rhomboid family intramembrane serine protease [Noviherbaspirillum sp.]|jgi:rhomboid protease GluP|uniref:rhomboid family intramembrane serine protease n=1 Tax=Noviherbaspirillum sp. TaxID=1926288 RepID=UPI002F9282A4
MDDRQHSGTAEQHFYSSGSSRVGTARRWNWICCAGILVTIALAMRQSPDRLLTIAALVLFGAGLFELLLRRQLKPGRPLVTLSAEGLASPRLTGKSRRYRWDEIDSIGFEQVQGVPHLQLRLSPASGRRDRRGFWTGVNPARPAINLAPFSREDQDRLFEAVTLRLQFFGGGLQPVANPLAEERAFQARLKALAPTLWVTYALVATNVLVWAITLNLGADVMHAAASQALDWGGNAASEVQRGEWWRLLTATFLHSGVLHLLMNMAGLIGAGVTVERIYGHRLFALIYLGAGLTGSALSLHFSAQQSVSVGASGAVFGVAGALLVAVLQHRDKLPKMFGKQTLTSIGFFVVYSLVQGLGRQGIDNAAHVGGLIGGCLLACVLPERFDAAHFHRQFRTRAAAAVALVAALTVGVAATAPAAAVDQRRAFDGIAQFESGMARLKGAFKVLQEDEQAVKNGAMPESEMDERTRRVHAPVFRKLHADLAAIYMRPGDPREPLVQDLARTAELLAEMLAMDSVVDADGKFHPVDPQRASAIEDEMQQLNERMQKRAAAAKAGQKS